MTQRICSFEDCLRPLLARGWCAKHYEAWRRHGGPAVESVHDRAARLRRQVAEAVAFRDRTTGCWTDGDFSRTRSVMYLEIGKTKVGHLAMKLDGRPRPLAPANHMLHSCDVKACWNPSHLRWGTRADNMADMVARGLQPRGERAGNVKLNETKVREIRARYAAGGISQKVLATEYGVERAVISLVVNRKSWAHVD